MNDLCWQGETEINVLLLVVIDSDELPCPISHIHNVQEWVKIVLYVAFSTFMAILRQKKARSLQYVLHLSNDFLHNYCNIATEGSLMSGICPILIEWLQGFFIVHNTTDNSFEQIEALYVDNLDDKHSTNTRDSNLVPLSLEPQPDRMSHSTIADS